MVDASTFNFQPSFPIASVAQLYADRPVKEQAIKTQQQQQLISGLNMFGQGVDSLVQRRMQMAQALAGAKYMAAQNPDMFYPQTTNVQAPVTQNQTAAYDPTTGSVTPNMGNAPVTSMPQPVTKPAALDIPTTATALFGTPFADVLKTQFEKQRLGQEQQRIGIEGRKADAEEKSNEIQRMIQGMLASNTIKNQAQERAQAADNAAFDSNKAILAAGSPLNPFNPVTFAQKRAALAAMTNKSGSNAGLGNNEVIRTSADGTKHVFDVSTKKFLRDL